MSRKEKTPGHLGSKKTERYIQASILLSLLSRPSYGYELIQEISRFGFMEGQVPPGMIYRHLRELEENGLLFSEWETDGAGPAKRIYQLTAEGMEVLGFWIEYMKKQAEKLLQFVDMYQDGIKEKE
ncbi:PadR family transcriptional regulator [Desulfococcus sp.]|uniref:PadR family transcriptional regulator n=1 Tax=Desulfococcus sp. TaxID=2025834 RepID=UPI0035934401